MYKRLVPGKTVSNLPTSPDDDMSTSVIPTIIRPTYKQHRKCERYNYIPHRNPNYNNRDEWSYAYDSHLYTMYRIVRRMIENMYPKVSIDWNDPKYYRAFNKLIYNCSSRYITPYIEEIEDDVIYSSKEVSDEDKGWEKQKGN